MFDSAVDVPAQACICIFVKPFVPGEVKTRLIPALGPKTAASLAEAFFQDVLADVQTLPWAIPIIASTEPLSGLVNSVGCEVWLQGEGDLGARLEGILLRALRQSSFAIAIGADSPGLPLSLLEDVRLKLRSADAAIGPGEDGGFYLLGVRQCPPGLLRDIPWSRPDTCVHTLTRLQQAGLKTSVLDPWFDVDTPADLARLETLILREEVRAPRTAEAMQRYSMNGDCSIPQALGGISCGSRCVE